MALSAPDASVVIPNYQGLRVLPRTLRSLEQALELSSLRVQVIVVDDASSDGSPERVAREHPRVTLLRHSFNQGFGPTCNLGAREARAPRVFFLNSDVSVHPGFLEPLVERLEVDDRFSATSVNLDEAGNVRPPNQVTPEMRRGQIRLRSVDLDRLRRAGALASLGPLETLFGSGGSLLVRRERFLALGGFADAFSPFYYEDADLGWRAWRRGWASVIEPASLVTHRSDGAIPSTQRRGFVKAIRKRNRFLLIWRNLIDPGALGRRHLALLPAYLVGSLLRGDASVVRGLAGALARRGGLAAFRARERAEAKLSDAEIFERLARTREHLLLHPVFSCPGGTASVACVRGRASR